MNKNTPFYLLVSIFLLLSQFNYSENTPAFPGAEGFGRYTTGGRGGDVYHVTSTADDGSVGTFRWAIEKSGKRTIVFDISGTIRLKSALALRNGNVTIAGQTAPGDGICIADYPFTINASNVIIRFIRFRLGNKNVAYHEGDGLGGMDQENIVIDHCSVSWSIDECLSVYGSKNITVQWCIISQSLQNSGHTKGAHGYGGNWGGSGASYHHNLLAHHNSRTPRLGPRPSTQLDERMDLRNNVIYNWAGNGCYGGEAMNVNIVNNYYKPGPGTKTRSTSIQYRIAAIGIRTTAYVGTSSTWAPTLHMWGNYYVNGNYMNGFSDVTADNWTKGIYEQISNSSVDNLFTPATRDTLKKDSPLNYVYTTTHTAQIAYDRVLQYAGASLKRDWVDTLMVYDARNTLASHTGVGTGNAPGIINSQEDNKPANAPTDWNAWPNLQSSALAIDTDKDGMPDAWESANGLNPTNAADGSSTNLDGYTMLEVYMNSLVSSIMTQENLGGVASGYIEGSSDTNTKNVTLSQSTYVGATNTSSPWAFEGGYTVTNNNGKGYSTGSELGVKYSNSVQFTVNLPEGISVDNVTFSGYNNYNGADSYLSELNGTSFSPTDYIFTQKDIVGNYTMCSHTVALATPATGSFTFTFEGKQVVLSIDLKTKITTGIQNYSLLPLNPNMPVNVYKIDGRLVKSNVMRSEATKNLTNGLYIIDGQKVNINNIKY